MLKSSKPLTDEVIMAYRQKLSAQLKHVLFARKLLKGPQAVSGLALLVCLAMVYQAGTAPAALNWTFETLTLACVVDVVLYMRMWNLRETIRAYFLANEKQVDEDCERNAIARYIRDGILASGRRVYRFDVYAMNSVTRDAMQASGDHPLGRMREIACAKKDASSEEAHQLSTQTSTQAAIS